MILSILALVVSASSLLLAFAGYRTGGEVIRVRPGFTRFHLKGAVFESEALVVNVQVINLGRYQSIMTGFRIRFERGEWLDLELQRRDDTERFGIVPGRDSRSVAIPAAGNVNLELLRTIARLPKSPRTVYVEVRLASGKRRTSGWWHARKLGDSKMFDPSLFQAWLGDVPADATMFVNAASFRSGDQITLSLTRPLENADIEGADNDG